MRGILEPMPSLESEAPAIRRQLERVLESPGFSRNERLTRFLRFVVEGHLEGKDRHQNRQRQGDAPGDVSFEAEHGQSQEEKYDGDNGRERGQAETAERAVKLLPGLHMGGP